MRLSNKPVGCWIDGVAVNNLSYADDMMLLDLTTGFIRHHDICVKYCCDHGLCYNGKKSDYLIFEARESSLCPRQNYNLKSNQCDLDLGLSM